MQHSNCKTQDEIRMLILSEEDNPWIVSGKENFLNDIAVST